jgi:uncharacterized membrane protein YgdD (TMEM256/DUF423 family)
MRTFFISAGALSAAIAVALGAMGAHALKAKAEAGILTSANLNAFETAVKYQMYHALALLLVGLMTPLLNEKWTKAAGGLFVAGTVLFSGSIYLLSLSPLFEANVRWLGPVTPLGGICFIAGWISLLVATLKKNK